MKLLSCSILATMFALSIVSAVLPDAPQMIDVPRRIQPRPVAAVDPQRPVAAVDPQRAALANVGGCCSGVYVTPDTVLTAKHCLRSKSIQVDCHPAQILHVSKESDVAVLRVTGGQPDHAWLPLAAAPPAPGAAVESLGYPAGQFARMEGIVKEAGIVQFGIFPFVRGELMIVTSHRVLPGNSGGPLLNAQGEVIGVASRASTDEAPRPESLWVHTTALRGAVHAAGVQLVAQGPAAVAFDKPILFIFVGSKCPACRRVERDYADPRTGLKQQLTAMFTVQFVDIDKQPEAVAQWGLTSKPAFRCPNWADNIYGYGSQAEFLARLAPELAQAYERPRPLEGAGDSPAPLGSPSPPPVVPSAPALPPLVPPPSAPPAFSVALAASTAAGAEPDPDLSGVTVIVLVARRELPGGAIGNQVVSALERLTEGPLRRRLQEKLGDKAEVRVLFQRLHPARYDALTEVAGLTGDVGVLVLVEKTDANIAKGFLLAQVEAAIKSAKDGRLENAPVEVLFERINAADYDAAESALKLDEVAAASAAESPGTDSPPWLLWVIGALAGVEGLIESWIGGRRERTVGNGAVAGTPPDLRTLGG